MQLTKRNVEALLALHHGTMLRGRRVGGAIARMHDRLEKAGLITWKNGRRALTIAGANVVCAEEARVALKAERASAP
jgi:hypothetical protein